MSSPCTKPIGPADPTWIALVADVAVLGDFFCCGGITEAGDVGIFTIAVVGIAAPDVVRTRDAFDVLIGQFTVDAVNHRAEFAGVNEQRLAAAVAELAVALVAG